MELLAPAGSMESIKAAVQNGADAVYFGAKDYNARHYADNIIDLKAAISYAHLRGCRAYLTLNTLLYDRELSGWLGTAREAAKLGIDAFIVQDIGGAAVLKRYFPDVSLHASTQMTVTNTDSALAMKRMGFSRVILARELSLPQVSRIADSAGIDVEVFAHGALCYCYSGQCHMSNTLGSRSANRGLCAQPCRLRYSIGNTEGHLLSTKDLCLLGNIPELTAAGISCIKIEGRMRRPEYVAAATRAYRKAIDGITIAEEDIELLKLTYNRGNFTGGMLMGDENILYPKQPNHIGIEAGKIESVSKDGIIIRGVERGVREGDLVREDTPDAKNYKVVRVEPGRGRATVVLDRQPVMSAGNSLLIVSNRASDEQLAESIKSNVRKTPVSAVLVLRIGERPELAVRAGDDMYTAVGGAAVESAHSKPLTHELILRQLHKTGDMPFYFESVDIEMDGFASLPVSGLNALRRKALDGLAKAVIGGRARAVSTAPYCFEGPARSGDDFAKPLLAAQVSNAEQLNAVAEFAGLIYLPVQLDFDWGSGALPPVTGVYPPIANDNDLSALKGMATRSGSLLVNGFVSTGKKMIADYGFNITNSESLAQMKEAGFSRVTLSPELNAAQMRSLSVPPGLETELIVYGRQNLFVSEYCPLNCGRTSCRLRDEAVSLGDRKAERFPLMRVFSATGCRVAVLNSRPLYMADKLGAIRADVLRMVFTVESAKECAAIARAYRHAIGGAKSGLSYDKSFTRGNYLK